MTIAELSAGGMASVLVPFPLAVDDHQTTNARFLSDKGAAIRLPQRDSGGEAAATGCAAWTGRRCWRWRKARATLRETRCGAHTSPICAM